MHKRILLVILLLLIGNIIFRPVQLNANNDEEDLEINGNPVKYYNTNEVVSVPLADEYNLLDFRGMWVATVWNLDFGVSYNVQTFKNQFIKLLDCLESYNFNTLFFQIRPNNDAFYKSELNPWSSWLAGIQGKSLTESNGNEFDPLLWMIEETHARNMQFMGWLNAYRVTHNTLFSDSSNSIDDDIVQSEVTNRLSRLDDKNFAKKSGNKKYILLGDIDSKIILNPGEPVVQNFIVDTVKEIVENYDIDGVHFDDYFYLDSSNSNLAEKVVNTLDEYKSADTAFNDNFNDYSSYITYRNGLETLANFRRRSVNQMIEGVSKVINKVNNEMNKNVQFGAKPAAVWTSTGRKISDREIGANVLTWSYSSYFDIYADSLYWAEKGWVDWIAPQIYFNFTNKEVPYADIVKWWAETITKSNEKLVNEGKKPVRLFIAHGIYRLDTDEPLEKRFTDEKELYYQLKYNQKFPVISGSSFYDYRTFNRNDTEVIKNTKVHLSEYWDKPSLPNLNSEFSNIYPNMNVLKTSEGLSIELLKNDKIIAYVIYKCQDNQELDLINDSNVYDLLYSHEKLTFTIPNDEYKYYIKAVNKDYALSKEYIELQDNLEISNVVLEKGKTIILDSSISDVKIDDTTILDLNGKTITGSKEGFSIVKVTDGNTTKYLMIKVVKNYYYDIVVQNGDNYELIINNSILSEDEDLVIKVKLNEAYNKSDYILNINDLKVNKSNIYDNEYLYDISDFYQTNTNIVISLDNVVINKYIVKFIINGEVFEQIVSHGDNAVKPEVNPLPGYTFIEFSNSTDNVTQDITTVAKFSLNEYKVNYESNGGEVIEPETVYYSQIANAPKIVRNGYIFLGWYIDNDYQIKYNDEKITSDIDLYAKWEGISQEISYVLDGGECPDLIYTSKVGETIFLPIPHKEGYKFCGWFVDDEYKEEVAYEDNDSNVKVIYNMTLYAEWQEDSGCNEGLSLQNMLYLICLLGILLLKRKK